MAEKKTEVTKDAVYPVQSTSSAPSDPWKPLIFKLGVNCLEEVLEWLSINDLRAIRQTCKPLRRAVDEFIHLYCPGASKGKQLKIMRSNIERHQNIDKHSMKFIKEIQMWAQYDDYFTADEIDRIKELFRSVSRLVVSAELVADNFYDELFQYCPKVKQLVVRKVHCDVVVRPNNDWLSRHYPMLEHIFLDDYDTGGYGNGWPTPELLGFFVLNPNVRSFATTFHYLWKNRGWLNGSKLQFDQLCVEGDCYLEHGMARICGFIKLLHEQGMYKRLNIYCHYLDNAYDLDEVLALPALHSLTLGCVVIKPPLPPIENVKELKFKHSNRSDTVNVKNVERLHFEEAVSTHLVPFICHSPTVEHIGVDSLEPKDYMEDGVIDLKGLNNERAKLLRPRKVTIYVQESIYLATKWALPTIDFKFVELKRAQAIQWETYF